MIKVEKVDVYGIEHAVRAMRNPMNSWDKSDSYVRQVDGDGIEISKYEEVGSNDLDLMRRLYKAGPEHRTYARMIYVWMDITAPLYWWKEMDRYTVGKSQVSTSTMHKIHAKEFTGDDFSLEHLDIESMLLLGNTIDHLNDCREKYIENKKDKSEWWQLIQMLPSSYNQKRTVCMSYETVLKIIRERTGHKLDEWNDFVSILKDLPYVKKIIGSPTEDNPVKSASAKI